MGVISCDCTRKTADPDDLELEVRKFPNGAGVPAYRFQCQTCGRRYGRNLDPFDLPNGESPKRVRWARDRVREQPRPSSLQRRRSAARSSASFQAQRRRVLERDRWTCCGCGFDEDPSELEVHHVRYPKNPEDEVPDDCLQTSCGACNLAEREARLAGGKGGRIG